ncbi:MAG: MFS transporter [Anaerolineales bacterium]
MLTVLRRRNYGLLWIAQLISMIGYWAMFAALPFFIYEMTGSVMATGAMFMIQVVPSLVFGSVAGVFVDRWDLRWTMIGSSLFRGAVLVMLLGVRSADMIWLVYLAGFLESTASQFFGPANNALLPTLVEKDQLLTANSLDSLGENGARLIGPALGGVLLAAIGLQGVIFVDIGSYVLAALLMYFIRVPQGVASPAPAEDSSAASALLAFWDEFVAGLKMVTGKPALSRIFLVLGIAALGDSILTVLLVPFFQDVVGVGSAEFGLVLTVRGMAGILGGIAIGAVGSKFKPNQLIPFGLIGTGVALVAMVFWPVFLISMLIMILLSVPLMAWLISSQTWIQSHAPGEYLGRVFGVYGTLSALLMLIGMTFASGLGDTLGISTTLYFGGGIYILSGLLALVLLPGISPAVESAEESQLSRKRT